MALREGHLTHCLVWSITQNEFFVAVLSLTSTTDQFQQGRRSRHNLNMTSSHSYLFFYPNAPNARVVPLEIPDDDYGGQALKAGMAEYKLADRDVSEFMLLQVW